MSNSFLKDIYRGILVAIENPRNYIKFEKLRKKLAVKIPMWHILKSKL